MVAFNEIQETCAMPIAVGILCMDLAAHLLSSLPDSRSNDDGCTHSYIDSRCVRFLKDRGAHVLPIFINKPVKYYEDIAKKVDGILLPGGAVFLEQSAASPDHDKRLTNHFVEASRIVFEISTREKIPLFCICLGMQIAVYHSVQGKGKASIRRDCVPMECALPITLEQGSGSSNLFRGMDDNFLRLMETTSFGVHSHRYAITKQALAQHNIDDQWLVLGTNKDKNGVEFISIMEHKKFPMYAFQIHPERNPNKNSEDCNKILAHFADRFLDECRKSCNNFTESHEDTPYMIVSKESKFPKELVEYRIYKQANE